MDPKLVKKLALSGVVIGFGMIVVGSEHIIRRCEKLEKENQSLRWAGLYFVAMIEREGIDLTEFDQIALNALQPNKEEEEDKS